MATSGTTNFIATRNDIVRQAALEVNAISAGIAMGDQMLADFVFRLNAMVKQWQAKGIHVWTISEATLFPAIGQVRYDIGGSAITSGHVATDYLSTTLAAEVASGATVITVADASSISSGDHIGIVKDDGTLQWTTVSGAPSGNTVTLAAALTDSAADGNDVLTYTTAQTVTRPLKITAARRYDPIDGRETEIAMISHSDYQRLTNKATRGTVSQAHYNRQVSAGYLYLWYAPDTVDEYITFTYRRMIEDFNASGDNPDFPTEWTGALISGLSDVMKIQYPVSPKRSQEIAVAAASTLLDMMGHDREEESIQFQPYEDL